MLSSSAKSTGRLPGHRQATADAEHLSRHVLGPGRREERDRMRDVLGTPNASHRHRADEPFTQPLGQAVGNSGVSVEPGQTTLAVMSWRATSRATDFVNAITPPLAPAYTVSPLDPTRPESLATFTIRPPRPRSIIGARNPCVTAITPIRLIATTRSQNAGSVSRKGCVSSQPAQLTTTSGTPNRAASTRVRQGAHRVDVRDVDAERLDHAPVGRRLIGGLAPRSPDRGRPRRRPVRRAPARARLRVRCRTRRR